MLLAPETSRNLNALGLLAICLVLAMTFYDQLAHSDLPCPLCLLQRLGFVAVGFGLCLNVIHGPRPRHYALMLIAALFGISVSGRQILLHIVPGTGSYGEPFLGLHFYTWAFVCFFLVLLGTAIMLLSEGQYRTEGRVPPARFGGRLLPKAAFALMVLLAAANAISALLECGPGVCDDDPATYKLLEEAAPRS